MKELRRSSLFPQMLLQLSAWQSPSPKNSTIRDLEEQRSDKAKELLARQLASYYVIYGPPDKLNKRMSQDRMHVLRKIEEAAQNYPVVQAAIEKSKQNLK